MHFKLYMPTTCWYVHTHCSLALNRPLDPPRLLETDQDNFHKCHRWKQYNFHTLPAPLSKLKIAIARLLGKAISTNQWYLLQPLSWCSVLQLKKEWTCMLLLGLKMIFVGGCHSVLHHQANRLNLGNRYLSPQTLRKTQKLLNQSRCRTKFHHTRCQSLLNHMSMFHKKAASRLRFHLQCSCSGFSPSWFGTPHIRSLFPAMCLHIHMKSNDLVPFLFLVEQKSKTEGSTKKMSWTVKTCLNFSWGRIWLTLVLEHRDHQGISYTFVCYIPLLEDKEIT